MLLTSYDPVLQVSPTFVYWHTLALLCHSQMLSELPTKISILGKGEKSLSHTVCVCTHARMCVCFSRVVFFLAVFLVFLTAG